MEQAVVRLDGEARPQPARDRLAAVRHQDDDRLQLGPDAVDRQDGRLGFEVGEEPAGRRK